MQIFCFFINQKLFMHLPNDLKKKVFNQKNYSI